MDDLARIADRLWPTRWSLRLERPPDGRDLWRARLRTRRGLVLLESFQPTARASLLSILDSLQRLDDHRRVRDGGHPRATGSKIAA